MMYFDFLKDHIVNWQAEEEDIINWSMATHSFIRSVLPTMEEISEQEVRLQQAGYNFPEMLKVFWREIGCGYLCSTEMLDNGLEEPSTILDIYFQEGDWRSVKLACDLLNTNELPFFHIGSLSYLTIGLEEGVNLGKIYRCGEEIAPNLISFVKCLLHNPTYYAELQLVN